MALALPARPPRSVGSPRTTRRRVALCAGHIFPRSTGLSARCCVSARHAASLPLLVCATALSAGPARAQQPTLPPAPGDTTAAGRGAPAPASPQDSARGSPAPALDSARGAAMRAAPDSAHASVTLDSARMRVTAGLARADSVLAHADTACARRNDAIPLACLAPLARRDSTAVRSLVLVAGRKLMQHAPRSGPRVPRNRAEFMRSAFGPAALLRAGATAGLEQVLGRPHWLPRNRAGFGLRFGLSLGTNALAAGIRYETVRLLGVSPAAFAPCTCQGTGGRMLHALAAPFRAETTFGERFSPLTPLTELSSGMVFATTSGGFHPRQGLEAGLTGMLSLSAVALLREFRPWGKWLR